MAQTNSNVASHSVGSMKAWSCTFTTAAGDSSLTFEHGFSYPVESRVTLEPGGIATPAPKISNSSGTCTATFDNTQGYSGTAYFMGR